MSVLAGKRTKRAETTAPYIPALIESSRLSLLTQKYINQNSHSVPESVCRNISHSLARIYPPRSLSLCQRLVGTLALVHIISLSAVTVTLTELQQRGRTNSYSPGSLPLALIHPLWESWRQLIWTPPPHPPPFILECNKKMETKQ